MLLQIVKRSEVERSQYIFFQGSTEDLRVLTLFKNGFELDGITAWMGWPSGLAICDDWQSMLGVSRRHADQARLANIVRPRRGVAAPPSPRR